MTTEQTATIEKKKQGRPAGYSPNAQAAKDGKPSVSVTVEGEEVVIRLPKKDLSRKLLADLI